MRICQKAPPASSWGCALRKEWCADPRVEVLGDASRWENSIENFERLHRTGQDTGSEFSVVMVDGADSGVTLRGGLLATDQGDSPMLPLLSLAEALGTIEILRHIHDSSTSLSMDSPVVPGAHAKIRDLLQGAPTFPVRFNETMPLELQTDLLHSRRSEWLFDQLQSGKSAVAWGRGVSSGVFVEEILGQSLISAAKGVLGAEGLVCSGLPYAMLKGPSTLQWLLLHHPKLLLSPGAISRILVPDELGQAVSSYGRALLLKATQEGGEEGNLHQAPANFRDWAAFGNSIASAGGLLLEGCLSSTLAVAHAVGASADLEELWQPIRHRNTQQEQQEEQQDKLHASDEVVDLFANSMGESVQDHVAKGSSAVLVERSALGLVALSDIMKKVAYWEKGERGAADRAFAQDRLSKCMGWQDLGGSGAGLCDWGGSQQIAYAYMTDRLGLFESDRLRSLLLGVARDVDAQQVPGD